MIRSAVGLALILLLASLFVSLADGVMKEDLHGVAVRYVTDGPRATGAANTVTSVVITYRGLDTLGEVVVLFTAATAVVLLLSLYPRQSMPSAPSRITAQCASVMPGPIILMGLYIIAHGHLTPGGGFPGGAVIASAALLVMLGSRQMPGVVRSLAAIESLAGISFGLLGLWGLSALGSFLDNSVLPLGTTGRLLSAGIMPLVSAAIGAKVAGELSAVLASLRTGGTA